MTQPEMHPIDNRQFAASGIMILTAYLLFAALTHGMIF